MKLHNLDFFNSRAAENSAENSYLDYLLFGISDSYDKGCVRHFSPIQSELRKLQYMSGLT